MLGKTFYHKTIKKYTSAFGSLFKNIQIQRFDSDENVVDQFQVPLRYAPKQRWYTRIAGESVINTAEHTIKMRLPCLAFNMSGISYDSERKLNTMQKHIYLTEDEGGKTQYQRVPYNFTFELNALTKELEDGMQIIEQICPYFTPSFTLPLSDIPEMNIQTDVSITLTDVNQEISYEGNKDADNRVIMDNFTFNLKGYLYSPTISGEEIRKVITQTYIMTDNPNTIESYTEPKPERVLQRRFYESPTLTLSGVSGTFTENETIYQGDNLGEATATGSVISWDSDTNILTIVSLDKWETDETVIGYSSGAEGNLEPSDNNESGEDFGG